MKLEEVKIVKIKETKVKAAEITKVLAVKVATHYANVACPFFTYQPKMGEEVKKLRKF